MDALQAGVAAMGMFYPARDVSNAAEQLGVGRSA